MIVMTIGLGFGRFAFTAIYPQMVREGIIDLRGGSLVASVNYAGYMLGALVMVRARAASAHRLSLVAIAGTTICLGAMAVATSLGALVFWRGLTGVFSAVAMVGSSLWLLQQRRRAVDAPLLYAGMGVGITLSAEILALATHAGLTSARLWLVLAGGTLLLSLLAAPRLFAGGLASLEGEVGAKAGVMVGRPVAAWPLIAAYGLAGLGCIVTATYLPLIVGLAMPGASTTQVWAVFGLGAVPSCFLWHWANVRFGTRTALRANLLIQAAGVALPQRAADLDRLPAEAACWSVERSSASSPSPCRRLSAPPGGRAKTCSRR